MSSDKSVPINLHILEKDYVVACPENERETLIASAQFLNDKLKEVRGSGKVVSTERIVVISALNIIHEYLQYKQKDEQYEQTINNELVRLQEKIGVTLSQLNN